MTEAEPLTIAQQIASRKQQLTSMRERATEMLAEGASSADTTSFLSKETDAFLVELITQTLEATRAAQDKTEFWQKCAVLAVGGTGRGERWPFSDVDLLFLSETTNPTFSEVAAAIVRDCWDYGLKLGQTVQTVAEARTLAKDDIQFATSLISARVLIGDEHLGSTFRDRIFRDLVKRRQTDFIDACVMSRVDERRQAGLAVKQLQPDIKRAPGGLRDVHLMQWIAWAVAGVTSIEDIHQAGLLSDKDAAKLTEAYEYISRIRMDLHLHAGKQHDTFTRDDQLRMAEERGIQPEPGRRPVEKMMQTYFRHSSSVADISNQFAKRHQPRSLTSRVLKPLTSHRFDKIFSVGREGIDIVSRHRDRVCSDPEAVLKLFLASLLYDIDPTPQVLERIRELVPSYPEELSVACGKRFRKLLRNPGDHGRVLRRMYSTGLLEYLIPQFRHARGLIQFNHYHSYTVDEHTLRAIEAADSFRNDEGIVGSAYRAVRHKASLLLAILLHDVGKGHDRDHSEVGAEIAELTGPRFTMSPHKAEMVVFLVRYHLKMSHLALRRDISDPRVVIDFAKEVGSPERLRMLYVLTAADITAVGPGVFNDWKAGLLAELYNRAMEVLSGKSGKHREEERIEAARAGVREEVAERSDPGSETDWVERELDLLPPFYLTGESPDRIARDLIRLREMPDDGIQTWGHYIGETDTVEYRVITRGNATEGCFHTIAGTLAALRMDILTASICTTRNGVAIDAFRVVDHDFEGVIPPDRIQQVADKVRSVLAGEVSVESLLSRRVAFSDKPEKDVSELKPRVVIDNDCSQRFTVIDVFTYDQPGLLYTLARALHEAGVSVQLARIGTHWDQVVDVFYVTESDGRKIASGERTDQIKEQLLAVIAKIGE